MDLQAAFKGSNIYPFSKRFIFFYMCACLSAVHLHLSSSCHVAHKASTQSRQPSLSAAAICTSLQFLHPAFSISLSAVLLHVVLGLPRFRRPSGAQVNAVLQSLFGSFLMMWPMNFHLLLHTSSLRFSISAIFRTSLFVILSCQRMLECSSKGFKCNSAALSATCQVSGRVAGNGVV